MDAKDLVGLEVVAAVETDNGLALLLDDGVIVTMTYVDGFGIYQGTNWQNEWDRIVADNS